MMTLFKDSKIKIVLAINIVLSILIIFSGHLFYMHIPAAKTIGSGLFVGLCLINIILGKTLFNKEKNIFVWILLAAQIFACIGDIVLEIDFANGAIIFGVGHILFLVAFYYLKKFSIKDLYFIIPLLVLVFLIFILYPSFNFRGMDVVIYAYGCILSIMLGKAMSNAFNSDINKVLKYTLFLGCLLFYLSDLFLLFYQFAGIDNGTRFMCLHLYYPANCVLALCAFISIYTSEKRD